MQVFAGIQQKTKMKLILSGVLCAGTFLFLGWVYYVVQAKEEQVAEIEDDIQSFFIEERHNRLLAELLTETADEREDLHSYFVNEDNLVSFIEELEATALSAGVGFTLTSVDERKDMPGLFLRFTADGSWEEVFTLLALIESYPKPMQTLSVNMRKREQGWEGDFHVVLNSFLTTQ